MKKTFIDQQPILLVDYAAGQYIPQIFCQLIESGFEFGFNDFYANNHIHGLISELSKTDSHLTIDYWDDWVDIVDYGHCFFVDANARKYDLYHNEDLWAIPERYNISDW